MKNIFLGLIATSLLSSFAVAESSATKMPDNKIENSISSEKVTSEVEINNVWARVARAGANSAIYLEMSNNTGAEIIGVNVYSDIANRTEIHQSFTDEKGTSKMRLIDKISIANGETISMQPGGIHIMLLGLRKDLNAGDSFDVTMRFENGTQKIFKVTVKN